MSECKEFECENMRDDVCRYDDEVVENACILCDLNNKCDRCKKQKKCKGDLKNGH